MRDVHATEFGWGTMVASLLFGAVVALVAQIAWGVVGSAAARRLGATHPTSARDLRLVWGAAALPQLMAVFVLLPLDLLFLGRASFTSDRLVDPMATAWAATSIALSLSLAAWSVWLFVTGIKTTTRLGSARSIAVASSALAVLGVLTVGLVVVAKVLAGAGS